MCSQDSFTKNPAGLGFYCFVEVFFHQYFFPCVTALWREGKNQSLALHTLVSGLLSCCLQLFHSSFALIRSKSLNQAPDQSISGVDPHMRQRHLLAGASWALGTKLTKRLGSGHWHAGLPEWLSDTCPVCQPLQSSYLSPIWDHLPAFYFPSCIQPLAEP